MDGSEIRRSCEETVPILLVDEAPLLMSNKLGRAGGEGGTFGVLCPNKGTGGRGADET